MPSSTTTETAAPVDLPVALAITTPFPDSPTTATLFQPRLFTLTARTADTGIGARVAIPVHAGRSTGYRHPHGTS